LNSTVVTGLGGMMPDLDVIASKVKVPLSVENSVRGGPDFPLPPGLVVKKLSPALGALEAGAWVGRGGLSYGGRHIHGAIS